MKLYIRQIRPYESIKWDNVEQTMVIKGYDKWYPEDMEDELRRDLKHYTYLEFEERYIEAE